MAGKKRAVPETTFSHKDLPSKDAVDKMDGNAVSLWTMKLIGSNGGCPPGVSRRNFLKKYLDNFKNNPSSQILPSKDVDSMDDKEVNSCIKTLIGGSGCCSSGDSRRILLKKYLDNFETKLSSQRDRQSKGHTESGQDPSTRHQEKDVEFASDAVEETYDFGASLRDLPPGKPLNIVLLRKTGHGKSATANSIFDDERFESALSTKSKTSKCKLETDIIGGRQIRLVDTPGTMDTRHIDDALQELGTAIALCPEGYDVFVIVLSIQVRITKEEEMAIDMLKNKFGPDILKKYGVLVFTHGDGFMKERKKTKKTFEEYITSETGYMQILLKECGYRCVLIDNSHEDPNIRRDQVIQIISTIDMLVEKNSGKRYTNDTFDKAHKKREEVLNELDKEKADLERERQAEMQIINGKYDRKFQAIEERRRNLTEPVGRFIAQELKGSGACFPPDALVTLHDGRTITIADLHIGHKVLSKAAFGTLEYSEVYFFAHKNQNVINEYINLSSSKQNTKLTPEHHIYIVRNGHMQTIAAREVKLGDSIIVLNKEISSLVDEPVTEVSKSTEIGIYAPITLSGTIIVNNVLASCYVDLVPPIYAHPMLWPLRQLYRLLPSLVSWINAEGKEGMPTWVQCIMDNLLD